MNPPTASWEITRSAGTYGTLIIMSLAAIVAIAGNFMVIVLFMKIKTIARLTPHVFLTNLALCDLILGIKLPLFFLVTLGYGDAWIFRDPTACLIAGIADSLAFRLVVASMIAVAVDRYLAVLHAVRYSSIMPEKRAFKVVILIWIYCVLWGLIPVVISVTNDPIISVYTYSRSHNICIFNPGPSHLLLYKVYVSVDLLLNFVGPLTVMTVCYLRIAMKVLKPKSVSDTLRRMMRNTSKKRLSHENTAGMSPIRAAMYKHAAEKQSAPNGVGIMIEGCESDSNPGSDDYVELPAITKVNHSANSRTDNSVSRVENSVSTSPSCHNNAEIPTSPTCTNFLIYQNVCPQSSSPAPHSNNPPGMSSKVRSLPSSPVKGVTIPFSSTPPSSSAPRSLPNSPLHSQKIGSSPASPKYINNKRVTVSNHSTPTRYAYGGSCSANSTPTHKVHQKKCTISNSDIGNFLYRSRSASWVSSKKVNIYPRNCSRSTVDSEYAATLKSSAKRMSTAFMSQLKRFSHASAVFSKMTKYQQKIARTTVMVYLSFFFCFIPFISSQVVTLTKHPDETESSSTSVFVFVSVCLIYFSACINVIIYGTMHRNIKTTFKGIFGSH